MISHLAGRVLHRDVDAIVVDVHGVGYLVHVPAGEAVPAVGHDVRLWTSLQVREDSLTLYGFLERSSLRLFELLLGSSGVGPRLALAALGTHRPDVLRTAIAAGDVATLTQVPGIGRKVADRLILELSGRLPAPPASGPAESGADAARESPALTEARSALVGLGYSAPEVADALEALGADAPEDTEGLLRALLRVLAGARHGDGVRR